MKKKLIRAATFLLVFALLFVQIVSLPDLAKADGTFGPSTKIVVQPLYWGDGSFNAIFKITTGYIKTIKTLKVLQGATEVYVFDNSQNQIYKEWPVVAGVGDECHGSSGFDTPRKLVWSQGDAAQEFTVQVIDSANGLRQSPAFKFPDASQFDPRTPERTRILTEFREPIDLILDRLKELFPPREGDFWFDPIDFPQLPLTNDQYMNNGGLKPEISQALGAIITNTYKGTGVSLDSGNLKLSNDGRNFVDQIHSAAAGVGSMIQTLTNDNVTDEEVAKAKIPFEVFGSNSCQTLPQTFEELKTQVSSIITFGEMEFANPYEQTGQDQCEAGFLGINAARNLPGFILCLAGTLVNQIADSLRDLAFSLFEKYAGL